MIVARMTLETAFILAIVVAAGLAAFTGKWMAIDFMGMRGPRRMQQRRRILILLGVTFVLLAILAALIWPHG